MLVVLVGLRVEFIGGRCKVKKCFVRSALIRS